MTEVTCLTVNQNQKQQTKVEWKLSKDDEEWKKNVAKALAIVIWMKKGNHLRWW